MLVAAGLANLHDCELEDINKLRECPGVGELIKTWGREDLEGQKREKKPAPKREKKPLKDD